MPDFYIVSPFFHKRSKQASVPTFVWLFRDVATTAKGPGCDEGTNLHRRDFAVVPLMPTRVIQTEKTDRLTSGTTDRQADRQVNKLKYFFFLFFVGGGGVVDIG